MCVCAVGGVRPAPRSEAPSLPQDLLEAAMMLPALRCTMRSQLPFLNKQGQTFMGRGRGLDVKSRLIRGWSWPCLLLLAPSLLWAVLIKEHFSRREGEKAESSLFNLGMKLSFAQEAELGSLAPSGTARGSPASSASPVQGSLMVSGTGLASVFRKCRAWS